MMYRMITYYAKMKQNRGRALFERKARARPRPGESCTSGKELAISVCNGHPGRGSLKKQACQRLTGGRGFLELAAELSKLHSHGGRGGRVPWGWGAVNTIEAGGQAVYH